MNKFFLKTIILLLVLVGFNSSSPKLPKGDEKDKVLAGVILHSLVAGHYQQKDINDDFSAKAFDLFLKNVDYNKRFFTEQDIEKLKKFKYQIDDEFKSGNYNLMKTSFEILDKRMKEAEGLYKDILSKPFNFEQDEYLETDTEKASYPKNKKEFDDVWRRFLKFQTMVKLNEMMDEQELARENSDTVKVRSFAELEADAREKVMRSQDTWFRRLRQLNENDKLAIYMNAVLSTYDPHSTYFPPKAKENFDIQLSGQLEGIGATLAEKDGYIRVEKVVPGSASWKQGELKAGDVILKVGQGKEDPVDIANMRLDDAVQLIRGKKGTEVRLTVKKIDGSIKVIPIVRDVVVLEETYAKSAVLENGLKVGYIKLPQFYADFNHNGGRSCADDVKKEIEKLKKDNVNGLILDLRNNGGGSLKDVVDMAGLFIDKGPIVQVRSSNGALEVLEDKDPSVQYGGPLVIMVNEMSASASEILAAAMQDYNRGVVIGGASTYGKGTVQRMVDLDMLVPSSFASFKPFGAMKLTTQKFYRVNGGATQLQGVHSDVVLPDEYAYLETGEKELEYAMPWDEIKAANFKKTAGIKNLDMVKSKSKQRVEANPVFKDINENALRLKKNSDRSRYSLNFEQYRKEQKILQKESKKFENLFTEISDLNVGMLTVEKAVITADTSKNARFNEWQTALKKDVYINEAIQVLKDMQ